MNFRHIRIATKPILGKCQCGNKHCPLKEQRWCKMLRKRRMRKMLRDEAKGESDV